LKTIDSQVKDSVKEGAEILTGGEQIGGTLYHQESTAPEEGFRSHHKPFTAAIPPRSPQTFIGINVNVSPY